MKVEGTTCTAYRKFADDSSPAQAFPKWGNGWNGANMGIGTCYTAAEFRNFTTRALVYGVHHRGDDQDPKASRIAPRPDVPPGVAGAGASPARYGLPEAAPLTDTTVLP